MLNLIPLRAFHAVAESGSLTHAAINLSRSQPALTLALSKLESDIGFPLLERNRSGAQLTPAGEIMHMRLTRMFDQLERALQEVKTSPRSPRRGVPHHITSAQLRLVAGIADYPDLENMARATGMTPASLRRTARTLEKALSCTLFETKSNRSIPTSACADLARRVKLGLSELDSARDEMAIARGIVETRIAIGMVPLCATGILTQTINAFLQNYPKAKLTIAHGPYLPLLEDLRFGRIDILYGVLRRPDWVDDIAEEPLFYDDYAIAVRRGHPLAAKASITLDDLGRYEWVAPPGDTPRRDSIERVFTGCKHQPRVPIETSSLNMQRALLMSSDRITLLTAQEMKQEMTIGSLQTLNFNPNITRRNDGIATRATWQATRVQNHFIELLRCNSRAL